MANPEESSLVHESNLNWAVIGATGFVGQGIVEALREAGSNEINPIKTPRLLGSSISDAQDVLASVQGQQELANTVNGLANMLKGSDIVVNAAGMAAPDSNNLESLYGANALLPVLVAKASKRVGVRKLIHISSVAVQGNKEVLDESSEVRPFSPYSRSKALGEQALTLWRNSLLKNHNVHIKVVTIRATSVQGPARQTTNALKRIARSPLASVARPGDQPSVVSSLAGLSQFVVAVGTYPADLPSTLIQPWEGASVRDVLELAGEGRDPIVIPKTVAKTGVRVLKTFGHMHPRVKGLARRLEVMWFGRRQVAGWFVDKGLHRSADRPTPMLRKALNTTTCNADINDL